MGRRVSDESYERPSRGAFVFPSLYPLPFISPPLPIVRRRERMPDVVPLFQQDAFGGVIFHVGEGEKSLIVPTGQINCLRKCSRPSFELLLSSRGPFRFFLRPFPRELLLRPREQINTGVTSNRPQSLLKVSDNADDAIPNPWIRRAGRKFFPSFVGLAVTTAVVVTFHESTRVSSFFFLRAEVYAVK